MSLIQIKSNERMPLVDLWRLIFKFTFDKNNCAYSTKKNIEDNIIKWNDLVIFQKRILTEQFGPGFDGYQPIGQKGSVLDEIEYQIGSMSSWVVREEKGEFQAKVDSYK